jgi:hypothetical protein
MPVLLQARYTAERQRRYWIGFVHAVELLSMRTPPPTPLRESRPDFCPMFWHGDNSHGCLVLGRAWADTYLVEVIAAATLRESCRQYLSVVLPNLCNFAQHDRGGPGDWRRIGLTQPGTKMTAQLSQTDPVRDYQGTITVDPLTLLFERWRGSPSSNDTATRVQDYLADRYQQMSKTEQIAVAAGAMLSSVVFECKSAARQAQRPLNGRGLTTTDSSNRMPG